MASSMSSSPINKMYRYSSEGWVKRIAGNYPKDWSTTSKDYGFFYNERDVFGYRAMIGQDKPEYKRKKPKKDGWSAEADLEASAPRPNKDPNKVIRRGGLVKKTEKNRRQESAILKGLDELEASAKNLRKKPLKQMDTEFAYIAGGGEKEKRKVKQIFRKMEKKASAEVMEARRREKAAQQQKVDFRVSDAARNMEGKKAHRNGAGSNNGRHLPPPPNMVNEEFFDFCYAVPWRL